MRIINVKYGARRDFYADLQCEFCNDIIKKVSCYDDSYFHEQVIPNMVCKNCGKHSVSQTSTARYNE